MLNNITKLLKALKKRDSMELKRLSNMFIERAAVEENKSLVDLSLIAYALYKMLSKLHLRDRPEWAAFLLDVEKDLAEAEGLGDKANLESILEKDIIRDIHEMNESFGNYMNDVLDQARTKQASRIYARGLSLSKALELTHADRYQVLQYIGDTRIHDRPFTSNMTVVDRYRIAKKVLGGGE